MSKKSLDDLFREAPMDDFGGPSPDVWRRLEGRLEAKLEERKKARAKRRIRFLQTGAVAGTIFLLGLAAAFVLFFQRKKDGEKAFPTPPPALIDSLRKDSLRLSF